VHLKSFDRDTTERIETVQENIDFLHTVLATLTACRCARHRPVLMTRC